jgi:hypothetical protein
MRSGPSAALRKGLGGIRGHRSTSQGRAARHNIRPGKILWDVHEAQSLTQKRVALGRIA